MPRITKIFDNIEMKSDGESSEGKKIIDISRELSAYYGKLVRQGMIFKCSNFTFTLKQDDTLVNNEVGGAIAGRLVYYEPTKYRKLAWKYAFKECQRHRKHEGKPTGNYDFRVNLDDGYLSGQAIANNAWIKADNYPLVLGGGVAGETGIFKTWNHNADKMRNSAGQPQNFMDFGSPVQFIDSSSGGDRDFFVNDTEYFMQNNASEQPQTLPFMAGFMNRIDEALTDAGPSASTWGSVYTFDVNAMCGLIGVVFDSTAIDATTLNDDISLLVSFDVEKWTPISPRRKARRSKKRSTRRRSGKGRRRSKRR